MRTRLLLLSLVTAAAAAAAAGCGKVTALVDGAPGGTDGKAADANLGPDANPRGTVKVTTYDPTGQHVATAGVQVVFLDPDGTLVARMPSDVNGKAQADVLPGGSVTAVWSVTSTFHQMETVLGVKPGDDLSMIGISNQDTRQVGTFNISWPSYNGATSYTAYTPCGNFGGSTTSTVATMMAYCVPTGPMTISVTARNANGPLAYLEQANINYTNGGSVGLAGTWGTFSSFQATLTNLDPAAENSVQVIRSAGPQAYETAAGYANITTGTTTTSIPTAGNTFRSPTTAGMALVETYVTGKNFTQQQHVFQGIAGNSFAYNLDVGSKLLPWVDQPVLDFTSGSVTVKLTGTGTIDAALLDIPYYDNGGGGSYDWIVVAPDVSGAIKLPKLPIEAGDVYPKATGQTQNTIGALTAIMEADQVTSYDQVRNNFAAVFAVVAPGVTNQWFAPVPTGFVRISLAQNGG